MNKIEGNSICPGCGFSQPFCSAEEMTSCMKCGRKYNRDYISFGDFCRGEMGMQSQYGMYLFEGLCNNPALGYYLRIKGNMDSYHSVQIHKDDAQKFKERYKAYRDDKLDECEKCTYVVHPAPNCLACIACRHDYFQNLGHVRTISVCSSKAPNWCPKKFQGQELEWREMMRKLNREK